MHTIKFFYEYMLSFLLLVSTVVPAVFILNPHKSRRYYIYNMTNSYLYIYFIATGCAGVAGKHGCKYKGFPIDRVCSHKYVMPGGVYSHKFMKGKTYLNYAFCKVNKKNHKVYALGRYKDNFIVKRNGKFYGVIL